VARGAVARVTRGALLGAPRGVVRPASGVLIAAFRRLATSRGVAAPASGRVAATWRGAATVASGRGAATVASGSRAATVAARPSVTAGRVRGRRGAASALRAASGALLETAATPAGIARPAATGSRHRHQCARVLSPGGGPFPPLGSLPEP